MKIETLQLKEFYGGRSEKKENGEVRKWKNLNVWRIWYADEFLREKRKEDGEKSGKKIERGRKKSFK